MRQRANMRHRAKFRSDRSEGSRGTKMCHNAKFHGDWSKTCWDSAIFSILKDGGRSHLGFLKCENFNGEKAQEGQSPSPCQISRQSVKPLLRYGHYSIFQDGGRRHLGWWRHHLGFSKCGNFRGGKAQDGQNASPFKILRRSAKLLQRYGHFFYLQDGGCRHSGFWKNVEILGVEMRHRAKFCGERPNRCGDMAIFLFIKMAAVAIFDFESVEILGVGRLKTAKMCHRAKFRGDRPNLCGDMAIFYFSRWRPPPS